MTADYQIEVRIKNARILGLMDRAGISNVAELSRRTKIGQTIIGRLVNLKEVPLTKDGGWKKQVLAVCDVLGCLPEDMFSERQMYSFMESNKRIVSVSEAEVEQILDARASLLTQPDDILALEDGGAMLETLIGKLTKRERVAIELYYGLDGVEGRTLEDVGKTLGCGKGRASQIIDRGLRRIRSPKNNSLLRDASETLMGFRHLPNGQYDEDGMPV